MSHAVINVEGMSCGHCVKAVEGALSKLAGVNEAKVSLADHNVTVQYDDSKVTVEAMKVAIEDQGYDVK